MMMKRINHAFYFLFRILLIVLVIFIFLELISWGAHSIYRATIVDSRVNREVYEGEEWAVDYFKEFKDSFEAEYFPYVGHRRIPNFQGKYINLNEDSIRKSANPCNKEKALHIFFFGGSAMWGTGARDEYTIPSYVAKILCQEGYNVEVTNFGESGYVSTQEVLRLLLELKKKNIPDIVVFYDGVNDVYAAYQQGIVGYPQNVDNRYFEFNLRNKFNIILPLLNTKFIRIINFGINKIFPTSRIGEGIGQEDIYKNINIDLSNNYQLVHVLGREYGFKSLFFLQPLLYTKENRSEEEIEHISKVEEDFFLEAYRDIMRNHEIIDLSDIFDDYSETLYIDSFHTGERGNFIVAQLISKEIIMLIKMDNDLGNGK